MTENQILLSGSVIELLSQFHTYSEARGRFLEHLNLSKSFRDPLAEFSEILVSKTLNATLVTSRVQKSYDLIRSNKRLVQVKYLLNPSRAWVNEHHVTFPEAVNEYALVIYISLKLESIIVFKRETLGQVCKLLGKKHPNQNISLQFTKRNYDSILSEESEFDKFGVEVYRFGDI